MNVQVSYSWLKEYIKTDKTAEEVAKLLSLHAMNVEYIKEIEGEKIFEIEITGNRPDCLSVIGLARELSVLLGKKLAEEEVKTHEQKENNKQAKLEIKILDQKLCPRYSGAVLSGVKVGDSPDFIQKRLKQAGLRPINNVVDITNYVMLERGNPLHAFDATDGLNEIIVRLAKKGEQMTTLDDQKLVLTDKDLIIADSKQVLGLAGIKGGKAREVTQETKRIILESANFNPSSIRQSSRRFSLVTDASLRFDKGLSPEGTETFLNRVIELLVKYAGAQLESQSDSHKPLSPAILVSLSQIGLNRLLGLDFSLTEAERILNNLGFEIVESKKNKITVTVPWWRQGEVELEVDLIEEVARIYGYYNLVSQALTGRLPQDNQSIKFALEKRVKDLLVDLGFTEIFSYSLTSKIIAGQPAVKIKNPLNSDFEYLRRDLTVSLLPVVAKNQKQTEDLNLFELSKVYWPGASEPAQEVNRLAVLKAGRETNQADFYNLKAVLEKTVNIFGNFKVNYQTLKNCPVWQEGQSAVVSANDQVIGAIGFINLSLLRKMSVKTAVVGFDISFDWLTDHFSDQKKFRPLAKFPTLNRDLALVVPKSKLWQEVEEIIKTSGRPYLRKLSVFDVYEGKGLAPDSRGVAVHLRYRSNKRTLRDKEVEILQNKIISKLAVSGIKVRE